MSTPDSRSAATQEWSPETGEVEPIIQNYRPGNKPTMAKPTPNEPVSVDAALSEVFSLFEDDVIPEGKAAFSGIVFLNGQEVHVRELDAQEKANATKADQILSDLMQGMAQATSNEESLVLSTRIEAQQRENWDTVIGLAVSGWKLTRPDGQPVPCTSETKSKLRPSQKALLFDKIMQRSSMGRDLTSFLSAP